MKNSVKTILNGLGVAIIIVDEERKIAYLNASSRALFADARRGKNLKKTIGSKKALEVVDNVLKGAPSTETHVTLQGVVPTSYRVSVAPMEAESGKRQVILSFEDVSHIRDAEKMREDFVANVSHELRSPLTSLYGFIETLRGPARDDEAARDRFLGLMQNESERMARLIDDLLSLSKLQASERDAPTEMADLLVVVESVVESLTGVMDKEGISIKLDFGGHRPKVAGMRDELFQVFQNLIENAIKYSPTGTEIYVTSSVSNKNKKFVGVHIQDQGEGIEPKHIPRLTERFYRIDKGRSRAKGGTGLGLAIVKHILIRHRGWLEISSEQGEGSVFTVNLPLPRAKALREKT